MISLILVLASVFAIFCICYARNARDHRKQGDPVNRVLWHEAHPGRDWAAGRSWDEIGRGYMIAYVRQGRNEDITEDGVDDLQWPYSLGYCVREAEDTAVINKLEARLQRQAQRIEMLLTENQRLAEMAEQADELQRSRDRSEADYRSLYESWQRQRAELEMEREKVESLSAYPDEPQKSMLTGEERTAEMLRMKNEGMSYREIAEAFGLADGTVKSIISRARKSAEPLPDNVVQLFQERDKDVASGR